MGANETPATTAPALPGIVHETLRPGNGLTRATLGSEVCAHYVGTLKATGKTFDSSRQQGKKPIRFRIGEEQVIKGCEEGVLLMTIGERALLTIPAHLAYGDGGGGGGIVPPNADLIFDVELLEIEGRTAASIKRYEEEVRKWASAKLASFDADEKFRNKRLKEHGSREGYEAFLDTKVREKLATVPRPKAAEAAAEKAGAQEGLAAEAAA
jgi:FK506-binding protein 1